MPAVVGGAIVTGALVAGGAQLLSAGMQAWFNSSAQSDALKESRRAEKLRIKFAEEETAREEKRFNRGFAYQKNQDNLNITKGLVDNLGNMFQSNRAASMQIANFNRQRS